MRSLIIVFSQRCLCLLQNYKPTYVKIKTLDFFIFNLTQSDNFKENTNFHFVDLNI